MSWIDGNPYLASSETTVGHIIGTKQLYYHNKFKNTKKNQQKWYRFFSEFTMNDDVYAPDNIS